MKFNKILLLCLLAFTFSFNLFSQVFDPVKWETKVEKISDTEYNLISTATIDAGWHLYSQNVPNNGPIPTTFVYTESKDFELIGKTSEEEGETIDDPVFQMRIKYFGEKAEFSQRIKVLNKELSLVDGEVEFMVCDDEKCLPPTFIDLTFNLKDAEDTKEIPAGMALNLTGNTTKILEPVKWSTSVEKLNDIELILVSTATIDSGWKLYAQNIEEGGPIPTSFDYTLKDGIELVGSTNEEKGEESIDKVFDMKIKYFRNTTEFRQKIKVSDATISSIVSEVGFMACDDTQCTAPTYIDLEYDLTKTVVASSDVTENSEADDDESSEGLWSIFIIAFFSGFVALLTPCVFPMIPMTVSFFI